jgi:CRISPR/Cas system CSM-associated protein Csm3 (group 7 of RAMP superfamily)
LEDECIGGSTSRGYGDVVVKDVKINKITKDIIENRAQEIIYNPTPSLAPALLSRV